LTSSRCPSSINANTMVVYGKQCGPVRLSQHAQLSSIDTHHLQQHPQYPIQWLDSACIRIQPGRQMRVQRKTMQAKCEREGLSNTSESDKRQRHCAACPSARHTQPSGDQSPQPETHQLSRQVLTHNNLCMQRSVKSTQHREIWSRVWGLSIVMVQHMPSAAPRPSERVS
jgi:hypothetical protein